MLLTKGTTEVLTIIGQNPIGINTADIFKRLVETYKDSAITAPEGVSKAVWTLRAKDYITSEKDLKKNRHRITKAGESALKRDDQERLELALVADSGSDAPSATGHDPAELSSARLPVASEAYTHLLTSRTKDASALTAVAWANAVSTAKQAGYTVLDPLDNVHYPFITLINAMEAASSHPGIASKEQKIATLDRIVNCNLVTDDIKTVLGDIITDLNQLKGLPA